MHKQSGWLMTLLVGSSLLIIGILFGWMDMNILFLYFSVPPWMIGVIAMVPLLPLLRGPLVLIRAGCFALFIGWCLLLPFIPWNNFKAFYRDANRLYVGMEVAEARAIMEPYQEMQIGANTCSRIDRDSPFLIKSGTTFIHSLQNWHGGVTMCFDGDKVEWIEISVPD